MSNIDPSKPAAGNATTQSVRDNFQVAADELDAVQAQADTNTTNISSNTGNIGGLDARLDVLEPQVSTNTGNIATNAAGIITAQAAADAAQVDATQALADAATAQGTANQGVSDAATAQAAADAAQGTANQGVSDAAAANANANSRILRAGDTMSAPLKGPVPVAADDYATRQFVLDTSAGGFPAGTVMLFYQAAAPVDWTIFAGANDRALRVAGAGGVVAGTSPFSTVFGQTATAAVTLTAAQSGVPAHSHNARFQGTSNLGGQNPGFTGGDQATAQAQTSTNAAANAASGHSHNMEMRVQYADVIMATKN